jgi:hypothetical protein
MYNKVNSTIVKGNRKPGRPFNTTKHPWRSTSIGKSFILPGIGRKCIGQMQQRLKSEGFIYISTPSTFGLVVTRVA